MAKRIVVEFYEFDPATRTITIPNKIIPQQNLLLVTNATSNTVIFNFSDPDLGVTNYTVPYSSYGTRFTLSYNTTSMSSSDPILIMEDVPNTSIDFGETVQDAVNKLRVASPESLIDTDFEYGLQPIKWESVPLLNNIPSYYFKSGGNSLNVTSVTTDSGTPYSTITVDCAEDTNVTAGEVVNVIYSGDYNADGTFIVTTAPTTRRFTYTANAVVTTSPYTSSIIVQTGGIFDNNNITQSIVVSSLASDDITGSTITVSTTGNHGLLPNSPIMVRNMTTTTVNGNWVVYDVPTPQSFRFQTASIKTGTSTPVIGATGNIIPRPETNFNHRSSDGGVLISTGRPQEGVQAIRQTRKYFRYQSGKGIQFSTGTKVTPTWDIDTITAVGTSVTVTTDQRLSITSGATVRIEGVECKATATNNPYNGTFTVTNVIYSSNTVTFNVSEAPDDTSPGGLPQMTCTNWKGSVCRIGMFDSQNGFFFEYDGEYFYTVVRRSTKELMGRVTVVRGSSTVTGTNTQFSKQLTGGDYIVIRGQTYLVLAIDSDTSLQIAPAYKGISISNVRANLTEDIRSPSSHWNLDKCDGTGPSGFLIDTRKMQMFYIDYSWYGAGRVKFGFRVTDGSVQYVHNVVNNNVNNQAYMRSGNLPARYEVNNIGPVSALYSGSTSTAGVALVSSATTLVVKDTYSVYWPSSGTIVVQQGNKSEVMTYTNKSYNTTLNAWNFTGLSRRQAGGTTSNVTFTPTAFQGGTGSSQVTINFVDCTCAPIVSHWGSSVIMDGGYGQDRSIVFSVSTARFSGGSKNINAGTSANLLAIRLAPSVDNSIIGNLGQRDIVNRMQLKPLSLGVISRGPVLITGILNPKIMTATNLPGQWGVTSITNLIGSGSLAQYCDFTSTTQTCIGGEQIFSFFADSGADTYTLNEVRELGNSILGGDGSNATPGFPVGPDVLVIVANNISSSTTRVEGARLSWTEAQA